MSIEKNIAAITKHKESVCVFKNIKLNILFKSFKNKVQKIIIVNKPLQAKHRELEKFEILNWAKIFEIVINVCG